MRGFAQARWLLALGAAAVLLGACAGGGQRLATGQRGGSLGGGSLEDLLAFRTPAECEPGAALKTLYDTMAAYDAAFQPQPRQPEVPERFAGLVGAPEVVVRAEDHAMFSLPVRGHWKNLPVRAVEGVYGIQSDNFGLAIVFDAPLERVRAVLEESGFAPAEPEAAMAAIAAEEPFGRAMVTGDARMARLVCDWGL